MMTNLIDRAKLLFHKDKELCLSLYDILGFFPHDIKLYHVALAHKSSKYHSEEQGRALNNERLEFLGDAILEAVVSDIIFHRYERKREGFLSTTRSKIVQRDTLNRLSKEIGLEALVKSRTKTVTHNNYLGGNAFEALIGAVYLDRGYRYCQRFVSHRIIDRLINLDDMAHKIVNFKSKFIEWSQKNRILAEFRLDETIDTTGNNPEFVSYAYIEGLMAGEGKGYSKKESQQQAAKAALNKLRREPQFIDRILRCKEKRTAMEADAFTAVPKIEEIEEDMRRQQHSGGSRAGERPAKPVKRRTRKAARKAQTEAATAAADSQKAAPAANGATPAKAPRNRRDDKQTDNTGSSAESTGRPATERQKTETSGENRADRTARTAKTATRRPQRNGKPATDGKEAAATDRDGATPAVKAAATDESSPRPAAGEAVKNNGTAGDAAQPASQRQPRRSRSAGPRNEAGEATGNAADREAIVRAAEEAAYKEDAL